MTRLAFLDLETTGLDPDRHQIWEIGVIIRDISQTPAGSPYPAGDDVEFLWRIKPNLACADPNGLRVCRFYERTAHHEEPDEPGAHNLAAWPDGNVPYWSAPAPVAFELAHLLDGAHMIGAVPSFDAAFLARFLPMYGQAYTAHYHLVDVENLVVGYLHGQAAAARAEIDQSITADVPLPWNSEQLSRAVGVDPDTYERHTALGDAKWARAIYDALQTEPT